MGTFKECLRHQSAKKYYPPPAAESADKPPLQVLDIGCGDSFFDHELLQNIGNTQVYGVDIFLKDDELLKEERYTTVNSLDSLPAQKFDLILMMDVLEHIKDDGQYLTDIKRLLCDDGTIFITVPAFQKLYSAHDAEVHHYRRYNHKTLHNALSFAGLQEKEWSYFYLSLIPPRLATMKKQGMISQWGRSRDDFVTRAVAWVLNTDFAVLTALSKVGLHLPGLSLMSVCKKC